MVCSGGGEREKNQTETGILLLSLLHLSKCFFCSKELLNENIYSYICVCSLGLHFPVFSVTPWKELNIANLVLHEQYVRHFSKADRVYTSESPCRVSLGLLNDQTLTPSIRIIHVNSFHLISFLVIFW